MAFQGAENISNIMWFEMPFVDTEGNIMEKKHLAWKHSRIKNVPLNEIHLAMQARYFCLRLTWMENRIHPMRSSSAKKIFI